LESGDIIKWTYKKSCDEDVRNGSFRREPAGGESRQPTSVKTITSELDIPKANAE
jgi:hypothetical protein